MIQSPIVSFCVFAVSITLILGNDACSALANGLASGKAEIVDSSSSSLTAVLRDSWNGYKKNFITDKGNVADSIQHVTTSEGQSYAMLRAVWMDDQPTFDAVWTWTQKNLAHQENDRLFSWKWGTRDDGSTGVIDTQSATDADQDIAFALLMAAKKWQRPDLQEEAIRIMADIWQTEVVNVKGQPYLTAGPWAAKLKNPRLNPSYMAPYIYREFAAVDPEKSHGWSALVDSSYAVLRQTLDFSWVHLPPDWCSIDSDSGSLTVERDDKASDYSYDAMRVPWRLAMDYQWNDEPRARELLTKLLFLRENWRLNHKLQASYTTYGVIRSFDEPLCTFGCSLPMFGILEPQMAQQILQERVLSVYKDGLFLPANDYYNNNWAWFGLAGYSGAIKP